MANKLSRYQQMEQYMSYALIVDAVLFIGYLIAAALGILWLKVAAAVLIGILSVGGLVYLYMTNELLRRRSLWMTAAFAAIILCTAASLLLRFPAPKIIPAETPVATFLFLLN